MVDHGSEYPGLHTHHHHNRDLALKKYILLQEQHEDLHQHLDELLSPISPSSGFNALHSQHHAYVPTVYPSTASSTPSASPTRTAFGSSGQTSPYASRSSSLSRGRRHRRQSLPANAEVGSFGKDGLACGQLEPVLDEVTLTRVAAEEAQLLDVNESIKRTLTELLNCETVRKDRALRTWVQSRLMDAEKELRVGRRRKGAVGVEVA